MRSMLAAVAAATLVAASCGGSDDDSGDSGGGDAASSDLVPISSLGLDIPFEIPWDIRVPADSTVALTTSDAGQDAVGLNSVAAVEPLVAEYDTWFPANFEITNDDPNLNSWQGIEVTDSGSRGISAFISTCEDCPDYSTRVLISIFEA